MGGEIGKGQIVKHWTLKNSPLVKPKRIRVLQAHYICIYAYNIQFICMGPDNLFSSPVLYKSIMLYSKNKPIFLHPLSSNPNPNLVSPSLKMVVNERGCGSDEETSMDLRKGPWTVDEDMLLNNYINIHGEGRWNSLARCAGGLANRLPCSLCFIDVGVSIF